MWPSFVLVLCNEEYVELLYRKEYCIRLKHKYREGKTLAKVKGHGAVSSKLQFECSYLIVIYIGNMSFH